MSAGILTDLTDTELREWLVEIWKVTDAPEEEALRAVDLLVWSVVEWSSVRQRLAATDPMTTPPVKATPPTIRSTT